MNKISKLIALSILLTTTCAHSQIISGNSSIDIYGSKSKVEIYDQSTLTAHLNSDISRLFGYDNSIINITGGETNKLNLYDSSTANITSGDINWLTLYENSEANISYLDELNKLVVSDDSLVNIYGSDFNYARRHLSGIWANGNSFSFWAIKDSDQSFGNSGNVLPDNIVLHIVSIPEPSSLVLLLLGFALLVNRKFKFNQSLLH